MSETIEKPNYDRVVELLQIIVNDMIAMDGSKNTVRYLADIGFTDNELNLVNLKPNDEIEADSDDDVSDDIDYEHDYPNLEPQDDRFVHD